MSEPITCYWCGRVGSRGFMPGRDIRPVCANRDACQKRAKVITPRGRLRRIGVLLDDPSWRTRPASELAEQVQEILDKGNP